MKKRLIKRSTLRRYKKRWVRYNRRMFARAAHRAARIQKAMNRQTYKLQKHKTYKPIYL